MNEMGNESVERVAVEYSSVPPHCFRCMGFGHYGADYGKDQTEGSAASF